MFQLRYLIINLKAFLIVFSAYVLLEIVQGQDFLAEIIYFEGVQLSAGSLLFFPLGATVFSYYLYGYRALFGVLLIKVLAGFFYNTPSEIFWEFTIIGWLGPLVAIILLRYFRLGFTGKTLDTNIGHIIFLIIFSAIINTLLKFIAFYSQHHLETLSEHWLQPDPLFFLSTFLPGDIIGGIIFFFGYLYLRSVWLNKKSID